jgi:transposase InsO family protein
MLARTPDGANPAVSSPDHGTPFTSRAFRARLAELGVTHRRGGYRTPSQAFIESWRSKLKQRCVWREEFETLDEAREKIGAYVDRYHYLAHGWPTARRAKSPAPGKITTTKSIPAA